MTGDLRRTLRLQDGLAIVIGITVGAGIFRTPGVVVAQLGRPWLTFVVWVLGGVVALLGALIFAELGTRYPRAGGKYVYAREAFGPRAGFVVGVVEALGIYAVAIAAIGVIVGEYTAQLAGWSPRTARLVGVGAVAVFTGINLIGVAPGRLVQNLATWIKLAALVAVVALAFSSGGGTGAAWDDQLPGAPAGLAVLGAVAMAFQSVIWTYYGYPDAAKIAEEVVDPNRTLPRILLGGIAVTVVLYLLLNAAFLYVLPLQQVASSKLVAGDVATAIFGARGEVVIAALALVVVLASLNGNVFVTPRVVFAMARDGIGPRVLSRVNAGGTPWAAMLLVGVVAIAIAASGTFEQLLGIAIALVLIIDGYTAFALLRVRRRDPRAPFLSPAFPVLPLVFIVIYAALLAGAFTADPSLALAAGTILAVAWGLSFLTVKP